MTDAPAPPSPPAPSSGPPPPDATRVPRAYRKASPEAWAAIQEAYVLGAPAPLLAEQHGLTAWAIRKRASIGGWTRREHARRTLALELPRLGGDRRPPDVAAAKASADREAELAPAAARARAAAAEAEASAEEADPLEAARTLLRRAAASAVAGRLAQAGAGVKLAEGLARAAGALGLDPAEAEEDDPWDGPDEPQLSPEALEDLRDDVRRRYARFDRPPAEAAPDAAVAPAEEGVRDAGAEVVAAPVAEAPAAAPRTGGEGRAAPRPAGWPEPEAAQTRGIGRPSRAISVSPWPAWAGLPDGWARSAREW